MRSVLRSETDGYDSASCHRDWEGTDCWRLPRRQSTGLHHRRDAHPDLDADQQPDVPAQVANVVHTDQRRHHSKLGHGDYKTTVYIASDT